MPSLAAVRTLLALLAANAALSVSADQASGLPAVPPEDALLLLTDGNRRFATGVPAHFQEDARRRAITARDGQHPFAVILTCADSRVPPELLFDQGIGCLFVARVAGNVARTDEVATIEYAVGHLGTRLVVVLGHTHCGAVTAVVEGAGVSPNLRELVAPIGPAVDSARINNLGAHGAELVELAIRANVRKTIADIHQLSPEISQLVASGRVQIVGAIYDIEAGTVEWLPPEPPPAEPVPARRPKSHTEPDTDTAPPLEPHAVPTPEPAEQH